MKVVIFGLSITSSWGNGHATTYRSLVHGLASRGHKVLFLERDVPWYAENRDDSNPMGAKTILYRSVDELITRFEPAVGNADLVIAGSFVPDGALIGGWVTSVARGVTAFYDIDTPVTLDKLARGAWEYITPGLIRRYRMYLSFTGGPVLMQIERRLGSPMARVLYCSVDPADYRPLKCPDLWDLGYLGTYSDDRRPVLQQLMLKPASNWQEGRFCVAGPLYPDNIEWPSNVERSNHVSPADHPAFYASQRFTLNITRAAMKKAGFSPSVRLFEAGACGTAIISDWWDGLDTILEPGREVLVAEDSEDTLRYLRDISDSDRLRIGEAARAAILAAHTPVDRATQLEAYVKEAKGAPRSRPATTTRRRAVPV